MDRFIRLLPFVLALLPTLVGCRQKNEEPSSLPDISAFASTPSDRFILDASGLAQVSRAFPYKGAGTSCPHAGAHLHFTDTGITYTEAIYSPVDGTVSRVDSCFIVGSNDRYGLAIDFASSGGQNVGFDILIEPIAGFACSGGVNGVDSGFFHPYILVSVGQSVTKGMPVARMYKPGGTGDGSHIHFDLIRANGGGFACPNIFTTTIAAQFATHYGSETCNGTVFPATFCYQPAPAEDLTGL